jgi:hypothetical protein
MSFFNIRRLFVLLIIITLLLSSASLALYVHSPSAKVVKNDIAKEKFPALFEVLEHKFTSINRNNSNEGINPYSFYSQEPAPMGIADYGLGINGQPYLYTTNQFLGIISGSINTYNASLNGDSNSLSFQLNVNLFFSDGNNNYAYWIQDVAYLNTSNNFVFFLDNIWNDSSFLGSSMYNSTVSGNGTVGNSQGTGFYYAWANQYLPGNFIYLPNPYKIQFLVVSYVTVYGQPAVAFMYNDGYGWITYDNAVFKFVNNLTNGPFFLVDGYNYEPDGNTYDAELIVGGPGGGTQTYDVSSQLMMYLEFWNGYNFQMVPNAYNFGDHTAEGISNVFSAEAIYPENGTFGAELINGSGQLGVLYQSNQLGYLNINLPINSGMLYVNNTPYEFDNYGLYISLFPSSYQTSSGWHWGYYTLYLYNSQGELVWASNINLVSNETLNIDLFNVTFIESGLPSGNGWWVNVSNGLSFYSTGNSISLLESNGSYTYSIATVNKNYAPSPSSGTFKVNGNNVNIAITFNLVTYTITFTENGLPSGTSWSVTLNGVVQSSTTNIIIFKEPNGSYSYTIVTPINGSAGIRYNALISSGNVIVNGANSTVDVSYETQYYLKMSANPSNGGSVNPTSGWYDAGSSVTISVISNSNFEFVSWSGIGNGSYSGTSTQVTITINGPITEQANFIEIYKITFIESGLPSGTKWYVNLSNGQSFSSTTNTITFSKSNGTYSFKIMTGNNDYAPKPSSGIVIVAGSNVNQIITFSLVEYSISFNEQGLPSGTTWYVNLSNGQSYSSSTSTITFNETNGTYSYTIATSNKEYAPTQYSGSFIVNGAPVSESITFNLVTYKITFTESGLSSGTNWYVTLNGITKSSMNNTIIFNESNGSYSYTIQDISGYRTNSYSGTINVNGNPVSNSITWTVITYPITITENGIPNGTSWSATLTGTTFNGEHINVTLISTTNTITFNEPNGTYSYIIHLPSGYQSNNTKGSVNVSGNSAIATFKVEQTMNYSLIGIIAVVIIIAIVIGIILLRKGKNKEEVREQKEPPKN